MLNKIPFLTAMHRWFPDDFREDTSPMKRLTLQRQVKPKKQYIETNK